MRGAKVMATAFVGPWTRDFGRLAGLAPGHVGERGRARAGVAVAAILDDGT